MRITKQFQFLAHHWLFWLVMITGIAIFLRALPALLNAAWGCDFGIYYGLTNSFIANGDLIGESPAWGGSYQYFPVLFAITGIAHWLTGVSVLTLMPKLVPIFGGLSVLVFYFIVNELLHDKRKALLASLFLSVIPFHVYQTSQAAPLTIGHFFYMLCLYCFIKSRKSSKYYIGLIISTSLLIMTHHLTMYFYLISIMFIIFFENARNHSWSVTVKNDFIYLIGASSATFLYWNLVATPVYEGFMDHGIVIGSYVFSTEMTLVFYYVVLAGLLPLAYLFRKKWPYSEKQHVIVRSSPLHLIGIILGLLGVISFVFLFDLPWANLYLSPKAVALALPLIIVIALGLLGFRQITRFTNWQFVFGWFGALSVSFVYGFISMNRTLLPHRHLEYVVAPLLIFMVFGLFSLSRYDYSFLSTWKTTLLKKRQLLYPFAVLLLVATNAASVYPSYLAWESIEESYETITDDNIAVIEWMNTELDHNTTVVTSDHRLNLLAEAMGFNTTHDKVIKLWNTTNLSDYKEELMGDINNYSQVTHVVIDSIMRNNVVHIGFRGIKSIMSNESYDKFKAAPYELIYRNVTYSNAMEEIHWTEVYKINWTKIDAIQTNASIN